jgi:hypothetical protein
VSVLGDAWASLSQQIGVPALIADAQQRLATAPGNAIIGATLPPNAAVLGQPVLDAGIARATVMPTNRPPLYAIMRGLRMTTAPSSARRTYRLRW